MKITKYLSALVTALFILGLMSACNKTAETNNTAANKPAANSASNANQPVANTTSTTNQTPADKPDSLSPSTAPTSPTEAYKFAYAAREKNDIEGLKKIFSKDLIAFMTEMGKGDGKTLDDSLKELVETPQAKTAEARNEKITGDRATLEYLDEKGSWSPMDFVKEDGQWKMTIPKADKKEANVKKPQDKKSDDLKQQ